MKYSAELEALIILVHAEEIAWVAEAHDLRVRFKGQLSNLAPRYARALEKMITKSVDRSPPIFVTDADDVEEIIETYPKSHRKLIELIARNSDNPTIMSLINQD